MASDYSMSDPLGRARVCLDGLSIGDGFGEMFFDRRRVTENWIEERQLPPSPWRYTDDSMMAMSVFSILQEYGEINQDALIQSFCENYNPRRGYGSGMHEALPRIANGEDWEKVAGSLFGGEGSYGNGASMRVAPVGAYFATDLDSVAENAAKSAQVTHAHSEATAGAIAVATGAALAYQSREEEAPNVHDFIEKVLEAVPDSLTRKTILEALSVSPEAPVREVVSRIGNGSKITTFDTVPFVLWSAGLHLDDYKEALWYTVSGLGDIDTTSAMVGGIVASRVGQEGIPEEWLDRREPLPDLPL
ncbi:MAG: ADP-ribosylglycohydrolase family protein [Candidatus Thorarchaeota archaeon]|nr:ADP-ribosylglycohydrolase family protein [Candidatus Thorarchaeota archaeon]